MLNWWLRTAEMEDVCILLGNVSSFFGILEVCHRTPLVASFGFVPANLTIAFPHGCTVKIVCAFQDGILAELLLDAQHGLLQVFSRSSLLVSVKRSTCKMP